MRHALTTSHVWVGESYPVRRPYGDVAGLLAALEERDHEITEVGRTREDGSRAITMDELDRLIMFASIEVAA